MVKKEKNRQGKGWVISFAPVLKYSAVFCLLVMVVIILGGTVLSYQRMKEEAQSSLLSAQAQISQRVEGSIQLLEALASLPEFYDPEVPPIDKVHKLDQMNPYFGYLMICYVDSEITVYSDGTEPASLASRDYMQWLFSTGERQVTDSFAAGADGVTLNYTVAVILRDPQGNITGCLFCAITFDEVVDILQQSIHVGGAQATLIGSKGQIMSSTAGLPYGVLIMDELQNSKLFRVTADQLQTQLLAAVPGHYWSFQDGDLYYTMYQRVDNTHWDILCSVSFLTIFKGILPNLLLVMGLTVMLCMGLMLILQHYIANQMKVVNVLVHSVEELERQIYQDECPEQRDFREIIRLTSDGLSDSLTGVVTRSVFLNQAQTQLKKADTDRVNVLCFVDLDNLKHINDTYGHNGGDVALKSVGYILREYEKKYDGLVGRYGGDEFILLLMNLDDEDELHSVLDELVLKLHSQIGSAGRHIPVQCSVGVTRIMPGQDLDKMIADADEALYFVKQNGKGDYKIHES